MSFEKIKGETFLFYGRPKIGKSSLAAKFPNPCFIATEPGLKYVNVDEKSKKHVNNWQEFCSVVNDLNTKSHGYQTYVVDTLDELWNFACDYLCNREEKDHVSDIGTMGKGWSMARDIMKNEMSKLYHNDKTTVFIAHATMKEIGPKDAKYTFVTMNMPGKAIEAVTARMDHLLYIASDKEGNRRIITQGTKNYEAGSRNGNLASKGSIELDFNKLMEAM
jgi:hypothetical protein